MQYSAMTGQSLFYLGEKDVRLIMPLASGLTEVKPDERLREVFENLKEEKGEYWLHERLQVLDPLAAQKIDARNYRRTIRALEVILTTGHKFSEQRRRLQAVLERLNAGLLLLEEKGKNLVEKLSELRAKVHQSETRRVRRETELEQLTEERTATDAQLKALYGRLGELRREAETARKERTAAEEELTAVNQNIRRARKEADDAKADLASLEQALAAFKLEVELLEERAESLRTQRASLVGALTARRAKLTELEQSRNRTVKELQLADSDVDKRVRVLESRRKALDETRDALAAIRGEVMGLEEVDRAFATATPALAWVLSADMGLGHQRAGHLFRHPAIPPHRDHLVLAAGRRGDAVRVRVEVAHHEGPGAFHASL